LMVVLRWWMKRGGKKRSWQFNLKPKVFCCAETKDDLGKLRTKRGDKKESREWWENCPAPRKTEKGGSHVLNTSRSKTGTRRREKGKPGERRGMQLSGGVWRTAVCVLSRKGLQKRGGGGSPGENQTKKAHFTKEGERMDRGEERGVGGNQA